MTIEGQNLELLIWDTAGQEVYRGLAPMYYRSALIAFIVYDVTKNESFDSVSYWIRELKTNVEENIVILVCGNKVDLEDKRTVDFQTAQSLATENNALYTETSATTGQGVDRMFQMAISTLLKQRSPGPQPTDTGVKLDQKKASTKDGKGCC